MAYPERKPIYEAQEKILEAIVERQKFREYADSEIEALDQDLLRSFRMIREKCLLQKYGPLKNVIPPKYPKSNFSCSFFVRTV